MSHSEYYLKLRTAFVICESLMIENKLRSDPSHPHYDLNYDEVERCFAIVLDRVQEESDLLLNLVKQQYLCDESTNDLENADLPTKEENENN